MADIYSLDVATLAAGIVIFWLAVIILLLYVIKVTRDVDRRIKTLSRRADA